MYFYATSTNWNQLFMTIDTSDGSVIGMKYRGSIQSPFIRSLTLISGKVVLLTQTGAEFTVMIYDTATESFTLTSFVTFVDEAYLATINLSSNFLTVYGSTTTGWVVYNANLKFPKTHEQFGDAGGLTISAVTDIVSASYTASGFVATDISMSEGILDSTSNELTMSSTSDSGKIYQWTGEAEMMTLDEAAAGSLALPLT